MQKVKLILRCMLPPGDVVLLTAAVRDLHESYPNRFITDVRTHFPELWSNNPYITPLSESDHSVEVVDCSIPLISAANRAPYHAIHGFTQFLSTYLKLPLHASRFHGDIYLSPEEKSWASQVREVVGEELPYWIIVAGGKNDITIKWWDHDRYQKVVDYFSGKIQFVQVGLMEHHHPKLDGVIDLRGRTDLRQLVRLVYHSQGVFCPVTLLMHLAAAVEGAMDSPKNRPCVVIAGGREPSHWEAYPHHQYIHTNGSLLCCDDGGCWKSRTRPIGDGAEEDRIENLCVDVSGNLPRCMDMITADEAVRRIGQYFDGGAINYLSKRQYRKLKTVVELGQAHQWSDLFFEQQIYPGAVREFLRGLTVEPKSYRGRGVVICAGGLKYIPAAWVCVGMLRKLGCKLPIEIWHLGEKEIDIHMRGLLRDINVAVIDALQIEHGNVHLNGWSIKPYAILNSRFREVLLLDADNVPVANPEYLFESEQFKSCGAVFWPDYGRLNVNRPIWRLADVKFKDEPEFESGQILVDKNRCWRALNLAMWYNVNCDVYYKYVHGDKDLFHLAFRKVRKRYSMPDRGIYSLQDTMCQHDFRGERIFQHRNLDKWSIFKTNPEILGFIYQEDCRGLLRQFCRLWGRRIRFSFGRHGKQCAEVVDYLLSGEFLYERAGLDKKTMQFESQGTITRYSGRDEIYWDLRMEDDKCILLVAGEEGLTCALVRESRDIWKGILITHENVQAVLTRTGLRRKTKTRPRTTQERIVLNAPVNGYTGYGLHACRIVEDLSSMGYDVVVRSMDTDEKFAPIPHFVLDRMVCDPQEDKWELLLHPPRHYPLTPKRKVVYFTMWESTALPREGIQQLNSAEVIVVPCRWNAEIFALSGVKTPIRIVPLGINTEVFHYWPMDLNGPCVFGVAGRMDGGGYRKGINDVIRVFKAAFSGDEDVELKVKAFPDCEIPQNCDDRIQILQEYLDESSVARWFREITCFVSGSKGEGWGLMQHQSMATGRPVIGCKFSGMTEFFDQNVGYCMDFHLRPAKGPYGGCGNWAEFNEEHMVELMRQVYNNRMEARALGIAAAAKVIPFSWRRSNRELTGVLKDVGMIK